jgi:DNA-binding PadR family transcriptional regulator
MHIRFTVYLVESMTTEVSISATEQVSEQVSEQVRLLLSCLQQGPLGGREAMKCAGLNHRPTFLYDYLQPAIQAGFVEMTQPDSPKSPTQKYRLTAKGRAALNTGQEKRSE